jgi:hypothetical protein
MYKILVAFPGDYQVSQSDGEFTNCIAVGQFPDYPTALDKLWEYQLAACSMFSIPCIVTIQLHTIA